MPVAFIPFAPPAPFHLPEPLAGTLGKPPFDQAAQAGVELMMKAGCADLILVALAQKDAAFHLVAGASTHPASVSLLETLAAEFSEGADFLAQSMEKGSVLLLMGEVAPTEADAFTPELRRYLLAGATAPRAIGFFYVFPLRGANGEAFGAIALHRQPASGPLNHDQPAIVHAVANLLSAAAAGPA